MYKNYFYLFRCVQQLEPFINGKQIVEVYTQEKDKLFLHLPLIGKPNFHLIVSTNLQQPYITIKNEHHKAKKNTINFFSEFLPSTIESIQIAIGDRVVQFVMNNGKITIVFKGGQSNIFFTDSQNILHSFKKNTLQEKKKHENEIAGLNFANSLSSLYELIERTNEEQSFKKMPFIGKDIIAEAELRTGNIKKNLLDIFNEINRENIVVYFDENLGKPKFHPKTFITATIPEDHTEFNNYFDAINKYFALSHSQSRVKNVRKEIEKFLAKEIETLSLRLNNLKIRVDLGSKETLYHHYGDLLLANIKLLHKGIKEIELNDYISGEKVKIILDEKLSPHQNIDRFYDKSRAEKIEYQKSKELLTFNQKEYERLIKIRNQFESTEEQDKLLEIKKELKMKSQTLNGEEKKDKYSFRHFLIENKYHIFVGKDSKNNDVLTTKFAKQNDFWFHARSVSGSHVVLRVENTKEIIPKNILQKTASVAAFYSKAKTSKLVPVTYTLKKYVIKNQRHETGQVTVTKENVLLVKPEIPKDCEMVVE
ncbi:MAG: NFACT RNA binding domain-containing protein [Melioribacteraceae bacterium]